MENININIDNYEAYALDYLEGKLDAQTSNAFEAFLNTNQEIKNEINDFREITVKDETPIIYPDKNLLYKKKSRLFNLYNLGIAASFLMLISVGTIWFISSQENLSQTNSLVNIENQTTKSNNTFVAEEESNRNSSTEPTISDAEVKDIASLKTIEIDNKKSLEGFQSIDNAKEKEVRIIKNTIISGEKEVNEIANVSPIQMTNDPSIQNNKENRLNLNLSDQTEKMNAVNDLAVNNSSYNPEVMRIGNSLEYQNKILRKEETLASLETLQMSLSMAPEEDRELAFQYQTRNIYTKTNNRLIGKFAFSNVTVSLLPSYFKIKK